MTFTHALATNNYGPAKFIVAVSAANGTHTTLTAAMAAASAGDTIFLRDSVTENITMTPGVNIAAWTGGSLNTPSITGKLTMTGAGTCTISGIELITNSDFFLVVSGSAASIINLNDCYLNCLNNTGISHTVSNTSSTININRCYGDLGTTGIGLFASSSTGVIFITYNFITNSGASTASSTMSAGNITLHWSEFRSPITTSSTASLGIFNSILNSGATNTTSLTVGGSGTSNSTNSNFMSGTASSISISTVLKIDNSVIDSTNTNAITGGGTISYGNLSFSNTSSTINTTTQSRAGVAQGNKVTAPTAGMVGEKISSSISVGAPVSLSTGATKTVTSISLTAGIWDVSTICVLNGTLQTRFRSGSSTTDNTLGAGGVGIDTFDTGVSATAAAGTTGVVPSFRYTLTSTTTIYLVAQSTFTGSANASGSIYATREG